VGGGGGGERDKEGRDFRDGCSFGGGLEGHFVGNWSNPNHHRHFLKMTLKYRMGRRLGREKRRGDHRQKKHGGNSMVGHLG